MSSRSSSRSEGEVLSSDSEAKANKSLSSRDNSKVDRHTRLYSSSAARHRRSRSPHESSRGEKRRRDDDLTRDRHRYDRRTHSVRYEDDSHGYPRHGSYHDRKTKRPRHNSSSPSRSRSRSRSPFRHPRASDAVLETKNETPADEHHRRKNFDERATPSRTEQDTNTAEVMKMNSVTKDLDKPNLGEYKARTITHPNDGHSTTSLQPSKADEINTKVIAPVDEEALIEERRKRREAIKNKYRNQSTPLLVQALHLGAESGPSTPGPDSPARSPGRSESPASFLPKTPEVTSGTQSPDFDAGSAAPEQEVNSPAGDEPSAADYDPTADMQEERARHDKRMFKEDDKSLEEASKLVTEHPDESEVQHVSKPKNVEFDMFAEDDDDDMFAEVPSARAPEVKQAQALDAKMMDNWDDHEGYYITILGELIENQYHVTQNLGRGMFSSVVRATDTKSGQAVAIKIVRNNETMRKAGHKEIDILKDISTNDPDDKKHVIRLLSSFDHKGHLCMVFENLSMNLREVLKKFGRDIGINIKAIRAYGQQLFLGLSLLRKCQYLHADLKPDNILVNEGRNILKICDLGSASPITENATAPYLVSRFYRAPEVILGIPYDYGIDMWSIGCTLFELYTGKILFTGRNNNNMLRAIMECRGKFPHKLLRRGALTYEYFDDLLNFRAQEVDKVTGRVVTKMIDIKAKPVRDLRSRLMPKGKKMEETERKELEVFLDLLDKCLDLRPDKRITPTEALKHPFISRVRT